MSKPPLPQPDPRLDLAFQRLVDIPPDKVWAAWTEPELVKQWFTPVPWRTVDCQIDLRPGGIFRTTMRSPEGQEFPHTGCILEVLPGRRLVWTNAMLPGFRPAVLPAGAPAVAFQFTATIMLEPAGKGTRYIAMVMHGDEDACRRHAAMGFEDGWGKALDQLVALMSRP